MILDLERLADKLEPRMRSAFLQAVRDAAARIDIAALVRMLENGDVNGALKVVGIDPSAFNQLAITHTDVYNQGGAAAARSIPPLPQPGGYAVRVLFDVRWPAAEQWIRERSSTLITEIVDDQRIATRGYLERGLVAGLNPRTVALDLAGRLDPATRRRTGGVIGLHSTQVAWLENYTRDLASKDPEALRRLLQRGLRDKRFDAAVRKALAEERGLDAATQVKMQQAYANRALKWRADNIARTETMQALSNAQTQAYQQAIDKGQLDVNLITRFPVTAGDERVRPTHRQVPEMNKQGRKWNEPFATPFGPRMHAPYDGEVNCRCHERIRVDFLGAVARDRS